jgi:hypothetical protein
LSAIEGQRQTRAGLVDEREREAGTLLWPYGPSAPAWSLGAGRSRLKRPDSLCRRTRRGSHRFGASDSLADRPHGALLQSTGEFADGGGFGAAINHRITSIERGRMAASHVGAAVRDSGAQSGRISPKVNVLEISRRRSHMALRCEDWLRINLCFRTVGDCIG